MSSTDFEINDPYTTHGSDIPLSGSHAQARNLYDITAKMVGDVPEEP